MAILALLWALYFGLHSLLAADPVKSWFQALWGAAYRYYRLLYNLIAVVSLLPILMYQFSLESTSLWDTNPATLSGGIILLIAGFAVIGLALNSYDLGEFAGTRYLNQVETQDTLRTSGLHQYVRHPLYFGTLLMMLGYVCLSGTDKSLVLLGVIGLYLIIGTLFEERKLLRIYGEQYREYQRAVPMLIPFL